MTYLHALILSIVEGITEFLPISSTGHLIITSRLLGLSATEFQKTFEIVIQGGAILAVLALYTKTLWKHKNLILKIGLAFLPTAVVGVTLYPFIKGFLLDNILVTLVALFVGGIVILIIESTISRKQKLLPPRELASITWKESFGLGLLQVLAFIPGVSRSGATIIGGLTARFPRTFLIEFSFLLAIPTLLAASGYDIIRSSIQFSYHETKLLLLGILVSGVIAYIVMRFILRYLKQNTFTVFGWYRIIIAIVGMLILI